MKKLSIFLIIAGILIALYPLGSYLYGGFGQARLMRELEQQSSLTEDFISANENVAEEYEGLQSIFETYDEEEEEIKEEVELKIQEGEAGKLLGTLEIPKINAEMPVVLGASQENLRIAAALMEGTTPIGEIGNAAIAAHRSHTYGRFFNRLDEMELGDEIIISTPQERFTYIVYEIKIVEPDDLSVLNRNRRDRVVTLITCDPIYEATHRLIIHGVIKDA
ncbi:class D sortase [Tindallia californiensis]|uniref:Sortase A n=1 Tax=Tindallia californiensis TaxID=159292 RepID=A0A1H3MUX1_9FIRM|nr:class D sortase [Tindallia californiensis]SDY80363.1 sortase A [Tindallia californiensis]